MEARLNYIDTAKAVGIFLVVLGHAHYVPEPLIVWIYSFHMPLFFFVSGYLMSNRKLSGDILSYVRQQANSLLLPYIIFFGISFVVWLLRVRITHEVSVSPLMALKGGLLAYGDVLVVNYPLWFFSCMFVVSLLFFCARKLSGIAFSALFLTIVGVMATFVFKGVTSPWSLTNALVAVSFYAGGNWFRLKGGPVELLSKRQAFVWLMVAVSLSVAVSLWNGRVDLNSMQFGQNPVYFFMGAYAGIASILLFSRIVYAGVLLQWVSRNTIIIFPLHAIFLGVLLFIQRRFLWHDDFSWQFGFFLALANSLIAIACCYPASYFLSLAFPVVFAKT
ncbi:MAG: acyltransferase family protein [Fluviicoccus sp.]|uniref:acyltransferase family protein n=1 Tax=Fluviicoccus sp. TaxID=2003552 RepID=UPI002719781A|nr:acyltransferase family protein [Fluviicoccus sp.]MDO8330192.1 acyltransferase family protein [Fluviicoccus sp.]